MQVDIKKMREMRRFLSGTGVKVRPGNAGVKGRPVLEGSLTMPLMPYHQRVIDAVIDLNNDPSRKVAVPSHLANYAYHVKEQWFREYNEMSGPSLLDVLYCSDD
ncbi:MAG: hypothetical protein Q8N99_00730 [Nanoarchaeota archaeon]|nr:hypothetical protein [Nanoarchaeota archaeon]